MTIFVGICTVLFLAYITLHFVVGEKSFTPTAQNSPHFCTIELRGKFQVAVADTPQLREKGLSLHAPLAQSEGMLFVFDSPEKRQFWMKDMLFPIDIIWLDGDLRVLSSSENLSPDSYPTRYESKEQMQYAIEVSAGTVLTRGIVSGDIATFDSNCKK